MCDDCETAVVLFVILLLKHVHSVCFVHKTINGRKFGGKKLRRDSDCVHIIIQMEKNIYCWRREKKGCILNSLLNENEKHWILTVRCSNETKQQQQQNQVQSKRKSTLLDYYYQKRRKIVCLCVLIFKCWTNVKYNMSATVLYLSPESPKPWEWINNNFSTKGIEPNWNCISNHFFFVPSSI